MLRFIAAAALSAVVCIPPAHADITVRLQNAYRIHPAEAARWFCRDYPAECAGPLKPEVARSTPENLKELQEVNTYVNTTVRYKTDNEHWGTEDRRYVVPVDGFDVVDRWSYPTDGYGDCEDFALEKKRMLIERGWPRSSLLITVVSGRGPVGKGQDNLHAILTVITDKGDFVLDIQSPGGDRKMNAEYNRVKLWYETHYTFLYRQSPTDPALWQTLIEPAPPVATK